MENNGFDKKLVIFSIIILSIVIIFNQVENAYSVATISVSPSSGTIGSNVTLSGNGYKKTTLSTSSVVESAQSTNLWNGAVNLNFFSGLTPNSVLTKYRLNTQNLGSGQFTYSIPEVAAATAFWANYVSLVGINTNTIDQNGTLDQLRLSVNDLGTTYAEFEKQIIETTSNSNSWNGTTNYEFFSGFDPNGFLNKIQLNFQTTSGHVRFLIYKDDGPSGCGSNNCPSTLIYSGSSTTIPSTGQPDFTLGNTTIPADGNIWVAFQLDNYVPALVDGIQASTCSNGSWNSGFHNVSTYGDSPNPAPSVTCGTGFATNSGATLPNKYLLPAVNVFWTGHTPHIRVKVYDATGSAGCMTGVNCPGNLLYDGTQTVITGTGTQNFTLGGTRVPANGKLWVGYEIDSNVLKLQDGSQGNLPCSDPFGAQRLLHTFGSGPNPAGTSTCGIGQDGVNSYLPDLRVFWSENTPQMRVKVYKDDGPSGCGSNNCPSTQIYDGPATNIPSTGQTNYTLGSTLVPADGKVWVGFETVNQQTTILDGSQGTACPSPPSWNGGWRLIHTFGSGPSPAGTSTCGIGINGGNGFEPDQVLYYSTPTNSGNVTLRWDGTITTPKFIITDELGKFLGQLFTIPNPTHGNPQIINGTDQNSNTATTNFNVITYTVQFKPMLHDNQTQLTSATVKITNSTTSQTLTANSTGWVKFTGLSGNQNFTVFDDKNFEVLKIINKNIQSDITQNLVTYDTPFNCISSAIGYQSDVILRINDTDGTHITNISTPTCANQNQISFNMTFTGNGQSGNTFSSSMITTAGSQAFAANPSSFTVSGTTVPTTFTQGNNIVSNSFTIGSGLVTTIKNFVITLTATHGTGSSSQSSGQNYFTTNSTCFAGVYDPKTSTCVFGPINITIPPVTINTDPNQQLNNNIGVSCDGTGSLTITSVNLGNNPLGIQIGQLPVTVNCGTPTPTQCPTGTTLTNGVCVAPLTCPIGSQTQNGICVGQLTCPDGTTLQNAQCIAQPTCPTGSVMVNGQCQQNTIPIILPPTPSDCSILNPVACVTTTTQSQDVVVTATTSDGRVVSSTTTLTKVINPELNNVSLVIILLIIAAIIAGIIYRYLTRKPKKSSGSRHGKSKKIEDFNKSVRKS